MNWQPIETAPKEKEWNFDQPSFLVWDGLKIWCVEAGLYPLGNGCGCCSEPVKATHWMPLPEPPK